MKIAAVMTILVLSGCSPQLYPEDELFITRQYVGQFVSHSAPGKVPFGEPAIMSIHTTIPDFDTIKVYSKKCDIQTGERVYIRLIQNRSYYYVLESGNQEYRICEFGMGSKLLTQTWY